MLFTIEFYTTKNNKCPLTDWLEDLDKQDRSKINMRLHRLQLGNLGNYKSLGHGIGELKIDYGPGYRIYYSMVESKIILLLCAGSKRTQSKDIEKAKELLKDYESRGKKHGKK